MGSKMKPSSNIAEVKKAFKVSLSAHFWLETTGLHAVMPPHLDHTCALNDVSVRRNQMFDTKKNGMIPAAEFIHTFRFYTALKAIAGRFCCSVLIVANALISFCPAFIINKRTIYTPSVL